MTPRSLTVRTCSIPARDCGRLCLVTCGRCRTNSLVLSKLIIRPLVSAHLLILENSAARVQSVFSGTSGTSKLVSSAYLKMTLASESGRTSLSMISQRVGPIPEPWRMLWVGKSAIRSVADLTTACEKKNDPL